MPTIPRCEVLPIAEHRVSFRIDGIEKTRWHFGTNYPRPYFSPVNNSQGISLTRMGHPGAPNHDHHQSVWFAHNKLLGIDFWSNNTDAHIRQVHWYVYEDGEDSATMAVRLDWFDGHDPKPLVEQDLIVIISPLDDGSYTLDLQSVFRPIAIEIEFQQTNFGFLAVRMAKSISAHFGGGQLTGASGDKGEPQLFGKANKWMDYSGPVAFIETTGDRNEMASGITYFDHPHNPGHPAKWHVREDGWMGASACRDNGLVTSQANPLRLRYLLHMHDGPLNRETAESVFVDWIKHPLLAVQKSTRPHQQFEIVEVS